MDLLSLLYVSVILCYTTEGKLVHEIDLVWGLHVLILEASVSNRPLFFRKRHNGP